jgi:SulP family sulfate permease
MWRTEMLAGLVVALALIPEAISFSLIAGVDPKVGLYASFTMAVAIAFVGGRPAMISAATGAMALVVVSLVREHGVEYLLRRRCWRVPSRSRSACSASRR